ncbi:hypothetical protein ETAA8_49750 [Anatilimnocola aggregata]|uniref:DUF1559 domain-containing protein n=1 Tax=Anatilimnocola aggregata TaxID=2528021 RepID=A0A517YI17_9BACT|nr:DUF1559 domain-containing protein [Anatilimnocola aggregata]QDU29859.1 hypothetical protein ETAA8_49750 [Anatilimnocola aggregata]
MRYRTAAFTLVELLVVIAIIGVMVALLLPAIQSAREAARRATCANHLTQLILGIQQYEQSHLLYPPGTIAQKSPIQNLPNDKHFNWIAHILPYVEQQAAYKNLDLSVSVYDLKNAPVMAMSPKLVTCPSSAVSAKGFSDYAAAHHDLEAAIDEQNSGVFFLNSKLRYEDLADGAANTLFLGEKLTDAFDLGWLSGTRATLRNGGGPINQLNFQNGLPRANRPSGGPVPGTATAEEQAVSMAPLPFTGVGFDAPGFVREGTQPGPYDPNFVSRDPDSTIPIPAFNNPNYVGSFGSSHALGANFAFGDGNVRFLADNMALSLLQALINRHDGKLAQQP